MDMIPVNILTFDELLARGWPLNDIAAEAFRLEFVHFGTGSYTAAQFAQMHSSPGGLCALLFPASCVEPGHACAVEACVERQAVDGTVAHQLVTVAVEPAQTGLGFGPLLDERCEELILDRGYRLRVLRSRAPTPIYAKYAGRVGGSPRAEATRFALKRGFGVMQAEDALNFFGRDITRMITDDVVAGRTVLQDCLIAESYPQGEQPPWYFICMSKRL